MYLLRITTVIALTMFMFSSCKNDAKTSNANNINKEIRIDTIYSMEVDSTGQKELEISLIDTVFLDPKK
ncbi:MAG: hypothetical protein GY754_21375 [bacterium]|nr:hypothetical protein [bacterium]